MRGRREVEDKSFWAMDVDKRERSASSPSFSSYITLLSDSSMSRLRSWSCKSFSNFSIINAANRGGSVSAKFRSLGSLSVLGMTLISIGFRFMCSLRMYRLWRLHLLESLSMLEVSVMDRVSSVRASLDRLWISLSCSEVGAYDTW